MSKEGNLEQFGLGGDFDLVQVVPTQKPARVRRRRAKYPHPPRIVSFKNGDQKGRSVPTIISERVGIRNIDSLLK